MEYSNGFYDKSMHGISAGADVVDELQSFILQESLNPLL